MKNYRYYPFSAIVGQSDMKMALIINLINPKLKGVLIQGERGTAKSTAVRSLSELMPNIDVVRDCPYNCDPNQPELLCPSCSGKHSLGEKLVPLSRPMQVVNLPIGATEDRVVGSIDIEKAVLKGKQHFSPGILARVNHGILYIDEVNLLSDHLIDLLLDVSAMGENIVEREGISFSHLSRFILVGTMNPEEGDLRPQIVDRFDMSVSIKGVNSSDEREEIVSRRLDFEHDPENFYNNWLSEQKELSKKITDASKRLTSVKISKDIICMAVQMAEKLLVDGHRAEIATVKAAQSIASFEGHTQVEEEDLSRAIRLTFPHRLKRLPFDEEVQADTIIDEALTRLLPTIDREIEEERVETAKKKAI